MGAQASTFRFLHVSDFHMQTPPHEHFQFARDAFLRDLGTLEPEKLNLVVLSGDFVNQACWNDDSKEHLAEFVDRIARLTTHAAFVAVPGNHDLDRRAATTEQCQLMATWDTNPQLRTTFFRDQHDPLRAYVDPAFAEFCTWWGGLNVRKPVPSMSGVLPGDLGGTIPFHQWRIGVLCLNTAFPCLTANASGEADLAQLGAVGGPDWCNAHHLCLVVTHDPIVKYDRRSRFQREFLATGYFAIHLFGDMHEAQMEGIVRGGVAWHQWQAGTLFGLAAPEVGFGYAIGEIDLVAGRIRAYPRRRLRQNFGPDPELLSDRGLATKSDGLATEWQPIRVRKLSKNGRSEGHDGPDSPDWPGPGRPDLPDWPRPFEILIPFRIDRPRGAGMSPEEAASKCTQLIFAHEFERALALFHDFAHELYFVQNAFDSSCAILKAVVEGIDTRSRPGWLAWTMDALGSFTGRLGRPAKAVEHYSEAVALSRNVNCPSKHLAMVLGNRFLELLRLGELARARADQDERIAILTELARDDFDAAFQLATAYLGSAYLRIMTADFDLAKTECDLAQQWFARSGRGDISFVPIARTILALELNANEPSLEHVENAERYAHEANRHSGAETGRDRIRALWALGVTLATKASLTGDAQVAMKARSLLRQALLECQCIDLKELEPDILIALALVERRIDLAREAQAITETCGYRLKNIDARLAQARLLVHANLEQANAAAASAASLAGPCGYQRGIFAAQRVQREIVHKTNRG